MAKLIQIIVALTILSATPAHATTALAQGLISPYRPVELFLSIEKREQILLYGLGPTLKTLGIRDKVIPDPNIVLYRLNNDGNRQQIAQNNDWGNDSTAGGISKALAELGVEFSAREAAMIRTLNPGRYVLKVTNAGPPANGFGSAGATTWNGDFNAGGPPVDPPSDIASGLWVGNTGSYELCFNVSSTGAALTQNGSRCLSEPLEDREALYIEFFLFPNCSAFDDNIDFFDVDSNIPIVNNKFRYTLRVDPPFIPAVTTVVEGTFSNGTLSGRVTRTVGSESCTGNFTARPQ